MSEDNKPQIIIHKSNWAWQLITVVIFLVILVALMVKNPSERDFARACVKEYTQRQLNADPGMSELVSNLIDQFIGSELALPIESNDYLVCSSFSFDQTLDDREVHIKAFGIWGKIIFTDVRIVSKKDVASLGNFPEELLGTWKRECVEFGSFDDLLIYKEGNSYYFNGYETYGEIYDISGSDDRFKFSYIAESNDGVEPFDVEISLRIDGDELYVEGEKVRYRCDSNY
jgi:hypothetical protein